MRKVFCVLLVLLLLFPAACGGVNFTADDTFAYFNTRLRWAHTAGERDGEIKSALFSLAEEVEHSLSAEGDGPIARFNAAGAGEKVELDETAYRALTLAGKMYEETDGAFDPALYLLVDLWGFSPRFEDGYAPALPYDREEPFSELPDEKYVQAFRTLTDFSEVILTEENGAYFAEKPKTLCEIDGNTYTMQLDLGGLGKGFYIDLAAGLLARENITEGYLSLAESSIRLLSDPRKEGFEVQLAHPRDVEKGHYLRGTFENISVSTSGDSVRSYTVDGKRFGHIIDRQTGRPADGGVASATVWSESAAEGDALSTALVVMGLERAKAFCKEKGLVAAIFAEDGTVYTTLQTFELLDPDLKAVRL